MQTRERIYRIWSDRRERDVAIRIEYSVLEGDGCKLVVLGRREEWE